MNPTYVSCLLFSLPSGESVHLSYLKEDQELGSSTMETSAQEQSPQEQQSIQNLHCVNEGLGPNDPPHMPIQDP